MVEKNGHKVVDADGHIMEPSSLWLENLEPKFRDKAMRITKGEDELEYLEIEGKKSKVLNGGLLGNLGALDEAVMDRAKDGFRPGVMDYEECRVPAAYDPHARVKWNEEHGIDVSIIFPSIGLNWQSECHDAALSAAHCRVYNDWIAEFCRPYPDKLVAAASISLKDVNEGVKEVKRAAKLGIKGVYLFPNPTNGIPYGDEYYDPFWAECEDMGLPIAIHVSSTPNHVGHELYPSGWAVNPWFFGLYFNGDCQLAFTSFFQGAVFDRFPKLSVGVVETGCGWMAHWLYLMDEKYKNFRTENYLGVLTNTKMKLLPSEYFERQCWITGEPDEPTFPHMAELIGAHKLAWGSDYPHPEGHGDPLGSMKNTIGNLSEDDQWKILGENMMREYHIN